MPPLLGPPNPFTAPYEPNACHQHALFGAATASTRSSRQLLDRPGESRGKSRKKRSPADTKCLTGVHAWRPTKKRHGPVAPSLAVSACTIFRTATPPFQFCAITIQQVIRGFVLRCSTGGAQVNQVMTSALPTTCINVAAHHHLELLDESSAPSQTSIIAPFRMVRVETSTHCRSQHFQNREYFRAQSDRPAARFCFLPSAHPRHPSPLNNVDLLDIAGRCVPRYFRFSVIAFIIL